MATPEEKQELVDNLSGPRYYRIIINGYGGESTYMSISKEAYEFWHSTCEEHGDNDLVNYMLNSEDGDYDFADIDDVPLEAQFMHENGEGYPWYDPPNEIEHTNGGTYDSCRITVDEVAYDAGHIREIIDREDISEFANRICEENNCEIELIEMGCCAEADAPYIAQMYSSEKGCFFDGIVETVGDFDPAKLKIFTTEYLNGEDTVTEVHYGKYKVDNEGGDTSGKGFFAAVWKN